MRAMALVAFGAWLTIGLHAGAPPSADALPAADLLPWQTLFRDLPGPTQRNYRAMEEGMGEAERVRLSTKAWPEVSALAADGVPPFAPDPIDKARYAWRYAREGDVVNYRGTPQDPSAPELMVVIQEPAPGTIDMAAEARIVDETHHLLPDGTLLHVTFWFRASHMPADSVIDRPNALGWTQILTGQTRKESS